MECNFCATLFPQTLTDTKPKTPVNTHFLAFSKSTKLTFNQGVRSSSLRWTTTKKTISNEMVFFVYVVIGADKNPAYYPEFVQGARNFFV